MNVFQRWACEEPHHGSTAKPGEARKFQDTSLFITKKTARAAVSVCAPRGIRILVLALKGLRPRPLDDGGDYTPPDSRRRRGMGQPEAAHAERADFIIPSNTGQALSR